LTQSDLFHLTRAEADIERPDKLSATADTLTPSGPRHGAKCIVIGSQGWLANSPTEQYQPNVEVVAFARLFDAQTGLGALLTRIEQPSPPQSHKDIWVTYGSVPADALSPLFPSLAGRTDPVMVDVDISQSDRQLVGLNLTGMLFPGESHPYSHIFSFSRYGAPVSIQPPAGV
ncbi:MAG TPA: LppX_LprAFG lipoprotein, partial [Ktedonobacterales bacterium]